MADGAASASDPVSTFAPFRYRAFTVLWAATLVSNVGTWMFNVTSGWLMTDLSPSPLMVSLVQAATSLPVFLFALPAGALGDIFDRRVVLMITQSFCAAVLFLFAALLMVDQISSWLLLLFTFLTGAGTAFSMPVWQAIVSRLVPRSVLPNAIALNGISVNSARAIGPAIGGLILAATGPVFTVAIDAASYLFVVAALLWWRSSASASATLPREDLAGAIRAGVRFALRSRPLRSTLVRAVAYFAFASAVWALLPLIARELLQGGPGLYGVLLAALGIGAVGGTFVLAPLKQRFGPNRLLAGATLCAAASLLLFAHGGAETVGVIAGLLGGVSWIAAISCLNISSQLALPDWVRARGMAVYQMVFFGAMTLGSVAWGQLASMIGLSVTLTAVAVLALLFIPVTWRYRLDLGEHLDFAPTRHWPEPVLYAPVEPDVGPVLVMLEYRIDRADRDGFLTLIQEFGVIRRRDGAVRWGVFEDVEVEGRMIETFVVESWLAHLRQHERVSASDKDLQDRINALHRGDGAPRVTHAVTPRRGGSVDLAHHRHDGQA